MANLTEAWATARRWGGGVGLINQVLDTIPPIRLRPTGAKAVHKALGHLYHLLQLNRWAFGANYDLLVQLIFQVAGMKLAFAKSIVKRDSRRTLAPVINLLAKQGQKTTAWIDVILRVGLHDTFLGYHSFIIKPVGWVCHEILILPAGRVKYPLLPGPPTMSASHHYFPWIRPAGIPINVWVSWKDRMMPCENEPDPGLFAEMDVDDDAGRLLASFPTLLLAQNDMTQVPWGAWVFSGLSTGRCEDVLTVATHEWRSASPIFPKAFQDIRHHIWPHPVTRQPGVAWEHWLNFRMPPFLAAAHTLDKPLIQFCWRMLTGRVESEANWGLPPTTHGQHVWWKILQHHLNGEQWKQLLMDVPQVRSLCEKELLEQHLSGDEEREERGRTRL